MIGPMGVSLREVGGATGGRGTMNKGWGAGLRSVGAGAKACWVGLIPVGGWAGQMGAGLRAVGGWG